MELNKFKKIEIEGGFFKEKQSFNLFPSPNDRVSIVYGKNGSGKSTISKAFSNFSTEKNDVFSTIKLLDNNDNILNLTIKEKNNIFVFNEEFIDNNVNFSPNGLETVVMFGKQSNIDDKIKLIQTTKEALEKSLILKEESLEKLSDDNNKDSPLYFQKNIRESLGKDGGWATREMIIKGNKNKSAVSENVVNSVTALNPDEKLEDLNVLFDKQNQQLEISSTASEEIIFNLDTINSSNYSEPSILNSLKKKIKEPISTEDLSVLINLIERGKQTLIESSKKHFEDSANTSCPYCLQNVTEDHRTKLLSNIHEVLNEEVDEHKKELKFLKMSNIDVPNIYLNEYKKIVPNLVLEIQDLKTIINEKIDEYNKQLLVKENNIYKPILLKTLNIENDIFKYNEKIKELHNEIKNHNNIIENRNNLVKLAQETNQKIAWYDIKGYLELLNQSKNEEKKLREEIIELRQKIANNNQAITELSAEKKNVNIALQKINEDLQYIFFSNNRLSLKYDDGKYKILSYGRDVETTKISAGERNIIALSYFFTKILKEVREGHEYKSEVLVIIDDPISSFDFENKIGIYSFLQSKIDDITHNNLNSKIIIFTHELEAMFNFTKLLQKYKKNVFTTSYQILESKTLNNFSFKTKRNEYNILLKKIYDYAIGNKVDDDDYTIGNTMRNVLEAFSTFNYRMNIMEITQDELLLEKLSPRQQKYFRNLMYRLVLNNESHSEEKMKSKPESNFYEFVSTAEKNRTSKDILSFMFLIEPNHIKLQFKENQDAVENIQDWIKNIN